MAATRKALIAKVHAGWVQLSEHDRQYIGRLMQATIAARKGTATKAQLRLLARVKRKHEK